MKRLVRWFRSGKRHKYINGGRGIISIFLAIIMLPFLSMADYLVESARYHEAVSIMDEVMDSASLSTLSNYDSYLLKRFGLTAVSQDKSMKETYEGYMNDNMSSFASLDISDTKVSGMYTLNDTGILGRQIVEISKYSAPTALAGDFLITDLIKVLEKMDRAKPLTNAAKITKAMGDMTDSLVSMSEDLVKLQELADGLEKKISSNDGNYSAFETAVSELSDAVKRRNEAQAKVDSIREEMSGLDDEDDASELASLRSDLSDAEDKLSKAEDEVTRKSGAFELAKSDYQKSIDALSENLSEYRKKTDSLIKNLENVAKNIRNVAKIKAQNAMDAESAANQDALKVRKETLDTRIDSASEEEKPRLIAERDSIVEQIADIKAANNNDKQIIDAAVDGATEFESAVREGMEQYKEDKIQESIDGLANCKTNVSALNSSDITEGYSLGRDNYYQKVSGYIGASYLLAIILAREEALQKDGLWDTLRAMNTTFRSLFKVNGFYDQRLDAYISADTSYVNSDMDNIIGDISILLNCLDGYKYGPIIGLVKVLTQLGEIIDAITSLLGHLVDYIMGIVSRSISFLNEMKADNIGKKVLINEYLVKNLSNRMNVLASSNVSGSSAFTGFSYSGVKFAETGPYNQVNIGGIDTLIDVLDNIKSGGEEEMFCGAELEYIITGTRSEIINQANVFMNLYMLRLLLDLGPIMKSTEVELIANGAGAASLGIGAVVVYVMYYLMEPMIDTIFLVNNVSISVWKERIYFTPSGIKDFLDKITKLQNPDFEQIKTESDQAFKNLHNGESSSAAREFLNWNYSQYLLVLMFLCGDSETYLQRFKTLISLEANAKYGKGTFQINNTYTYLEAEVKGTYNPILPLQGLSEDGFSSVSRTRARGY